MSSCELIKFQFGYDCLELVNQLINKKSILDTFFSLRITIQLTKVEISLINSTSFAKNFLNVFRLAKTFRLYKTSQLLKTVRFYTAEVNWGWVIIDVDNLNSYRPLEILFVLRSYTNRAYCSHRTDLFFVSESSWRI